MTTPTSCCEKCGCDGRKCADSKDWRQRFPQCRDMNFCHDPNCECHKKPDPAFLEVSEILEIAAPTPSGEKWEEEFDDQFIDLQEHDGLAYKQIKDFISRHLSLAREEGQKTAHEELFKQEANGFLAGAAQERARLRKVVEGQISDTHPQNAKLRLMMNGTLKSILKELE